MAARLPASASTRWRTTPDQHTGSLWSSTGTLLATVTFTNESISGWQTATFSNPVEITEGTTYVASYHTSGTYAADAELLRDRHSRRPADGALVGQQRRKRRLYLFRQVPRSQPAAIRPPTIGSTSSSSSRPSTLCRSPATTTASLVYPTAIAVIRRRLLCLPTTATRTAIRSRSQASATPPMAPWRLTARPAPSPSRRPPAISGRQASPIRYRTAVAARRRPRSSMTVAPSDTTVKPVLAVERAQHSFRERPWLRRTGREVHSHRPGIITGLRYYKSAQDTGTHTGSLWTSTGTLLAHATFTNESASGWQTVHFRAAGRGCGRHHLCRKLSLQRLLWRDAELLRDQPYQRPAHGAVSGQRRKRRLRLWHEHVCSRRPAYNATNYWVDVLYEQANGKLCAGGRRRSRLLRVATTRRLSLQASTLARQRQRRQQRPADHHRRRQCRERHGRLRQPDQRHHLYADERICPAIASFTYTISDGNGGTDTAQVSLSVDPAGGTQNLFGIRPRPRPVTVNDPGDVELGMKFQADVAGVDHRHPLLQGPQKMSGRTKRICGPRTGRCLQARPSPTRPRAAGRPSACPRKSPSRPDTTYVVSYHSNGFYSATPALLRTRSSSNGRICRRLSSASSGGNGVYAYGPSGLFPTNSFNATNYYVDVAFRPQLAA